jgi:hypothetical protein
MNVACPPTSEMEKGGKTIAGRLSLEPARFRKEERSTHYRV